MNKTNIDSKLIDEIIICLDDLQFKTLSAEKHSETKTRLVELYKKFLSQVEKEYK